MATHLEQESHSLAQLAKVMALYRTPNLAPREALFLVTQLVNHGYPEARSVLDALSSAYRNEAARSYLARLNMRYSAIKSMPALKTTFADQKAMQQLYATGGYVFRPGTENAGTAVIIFTTMFNNFHFSNAVLDAAFAGLGVSRLFLKDTSQYAYLRGVEGLADDLRDLPAALVEFLKSHGVSRYIITGHSSGGYPALYAALAMKPAGYVGYSIFSDISDTAQVECPAIYRKIRNELPDALFMNLAARWEEHAAPPPGQLYYGERTALDRAHAGLLRGCRQMTVTGLEDSHHDVTSYLLEEGLFLKPFEALLGA